MKFTASIEIEGNPNGEFVKQLGVWKKAQEHDHRKAHFNIFIADRIIASTNPNLGISHIPDELSQKIISGLNSGELVQIVEIEIEPKITDICL